MACGYALHLPIRHHNFEFWDHPNRANPPRSSANGLPRELRPRHRRPVRDDAIRNTVDELQVPDVRSAQPGGAEARSPPPGRQLASPPSVFDGLLEIPDEDQHESTASDIVTNIDYESALSLPYDREDANVDLNSEPSVSSSDPAADHWSCTGGGDGRHCVWKVDAADFGGWGTPCSCPRLAKALSSLARLNHPDPGSTTKLQRVRHAACDYLPRSRKLRIFEYSRAGLEPAPRYQRARRLQGQRRRLEGDMDRIATTGFYKMSDRQVALRETGSSKNLKAMVLDWSNGVIVPFWFNDKILFLARYALDEFKFLKRHGLPLRRAINIAECEIARAPLSTEPVLTAAEFFAGKFVPPKLIDLASGTSFTSPAPPSSILPTRVCCAAACCCRSHPHADTHVHRACAPAYFCPTREVGTCSCAKKNVMLIAELREAREKICNLEL
ncbi:hypothetical protein FB107DRAFT_251684 [Schizophyllum commune]